MAHVGENLLSKLRDGVITINPELASALLATVDAVRFMLGQIEITGQPGDRDFSSLIELLTRLNDGKSDKAGSMPSPAPGAAVAVAPTTSPDQAPGVVTARGRLNPPPA